MEPSPDLTDEGDLVTEDEGADRGRRDDQVLIIESVRLRSLAEDENAIRAL